MKSLMILNLLTRRRERMGEFHSYLFFNLDNYVYETCTETGLMTICTLDCISR
jgi:hypothetical protein